MTAVAHRSNSDPTPPRARQRAGGGDAVARSGACEGRGGDQRERRDIVSGEVMPENRLLRFVAGPDGQVVPDVAAKLPGRGLWVEASKVAIAKAVERKLFSRAAKAQVSADADLADRAEKALVSRMLGDLGIARRAGSLVLGFDNVLRQLDGPKPPRLLIEAFDGAPDGKRKLYAAAHRLELNCVVIETLTSAELGLALGRENVIHAAVQPGGLADRLMFDAERLSGFRGRNERDS
ncbi:MAG TPA: RNA-binding protein [Rhizomicrobium sp.]|nr:RNA-binding protein [Rhizomicrobium sp.]